VLYITSRRFTQRNQPATHVKIYSNAKTVEALLNGTSLGEKKGTNGVFVWEGVTLQPGENQVEARAAKDGTNLLDRCAWNLKIAKGP
jgi:beta-galactosidase